jgi:c-di-GMP-binding flagellar brake protein YcgR
MIENGRGETEGRRFERFDVDCRVKLIRNRIGKASVHFGRASNVSMGGIMLTLPAELDAGESVQLEFNLPNLTQVLQLRGIVRQRLGNYTYGIEFRDMTEAARQSITRMCETLRVLDNAGR